MYSSRVKVRTQLQENSYVFTFYFTFSYFLDTKRAAASSVRAAPMSANSHCAAKPDDDPIGRSLSQCS